MHRRTQIPSTRKGRIHVLESRSEVPALAPGNDQRNARPLPAAKGKSETATIRLSTPNNVPSCLERFACEHELVALIQEHPETIGQDVHIVPWICFQDAFISDPFHDPILVDVLGSK